jgi:hypothetical protein
VGQVAVLAAQRHQLFVLVVLAHLVRVMRGAHQLLIWLEVLAVAVLAQLDKTVQLQLRAAMEALD